MSTSKLQRISARSTQRSLHYKHPVRFFLLVYEQKCEFKLDKLAQEWRGRNFL
ncbi:hypothetical protein [Nostoc sp.]|uniref:hypothetical protein n=1 Tax=Nostoc sp. TaxID=1180 RepID=UPI002FFCCDA7